MRTHSSDVLAHVQALLRERFSLADEAVRPESELASLGIDSLAALEFIFDLEEHFDVSLPQDRKELRTIQDVVHLVESALPKDAVPQ